ncbi:flavin reductase family protein [Rhodococcus sp. NPDC047139]|jgi:flavin reductase (DIM6/NTAB) family NADH-FMN oxidoreductase RutF|uniref:flavin reductase family protein n=1 Tax=Rhodococcus sp. NPDC047139 TaxID=3155141 RepID=UPI00340A7678
MEAVRRVFDPTESSPGRFYGLLTATVVPRPIAWVSTESEDGVFNLAPYSFFTVASTNPPVVQFTSVGRKDSLRNIEQTGEFVINIATVRLMDQVNASSAPFSHDVDEFAEVGLHAEPSERVRPPRVAEAPASIECRLRRVIEVGDSFVVMGDVLALTVDPEVLAEDGMPDFAALGAASRLGRTEWGLTPRVRKLERPGSPV